MAKTFRGEREKGEEGKKGSGLEWEGETREGTKEGARERGCEMI
jgi:hypothetical protein